MKAIQKEQGAILQENRAILHAVREAQEFHKAELDRLNVNTARIEGDVAEIKIEQERTTENVNFLVRKSIEHEDDIRKLKKAK